MLGIEFADDAKAQAQFALNIRRSPDRGTAVFRNVRLEWSMLKRSLPQSALPP